MHVSAMAAVAGKDLPDDIIENIFSRLPVKSLMRFTCVSKKYKNLILSDPAFAKAQFKLTSGDRLLIPELGSLDLDPPSFNDIRKPKFGFLPPESENEFTALGSCNGLMFIRGVWMEDFFVCNPSTGLFKKLPSESFDEYEGHCVDTGAYHGVGYLSATDDYKVVVDHTVLDKGIGLRVKAEWVMIFSLRARVWKRMKKPSQLIAGEGTLSNEALHWVHYAAQAQHEMVVFDLAREDFRIRQLPEFDDAKHFCRLGVSTGGNLCVLCYPQGACDSLDFWVLRDYEVDDSWSQLCNLNFLDPEQQLLDQFSRFLVMKSCAVVIRTGKNDVSILRFDPKEGKLDRYNIHDIEGSPCTLRVTLYEESLLWIDEPPDDPTAVDREEAMEREIEGVEMDRAREQALDEEKRKPKKRRKEKEMMSQVNSPPQEEDLRM